MSGHLIKTYRGRNLVFLKNYGTAAIRRPPGVHAQEFYCSGAEGTQAIRARAEGPRQLPMALTFRLAGVADDLTYCGFAHIMSRKAEMLASFRSCYFSFDEVETEVCPRPAVHSFDRLASARHQLTWWVSGAIHH